MTVFEACKKINTQVRKFLKNNEIYLTTITSILLSGMAIVVAITSNNIAERQADIDYFEKTPDFHISAEQLRDPETGMVDNIQLVISKVGGKAKNINVETISFMDVELTDSAFKQTNDTLLLLHYYDAKFRTGNAEGHIYTIAAHNNNKKFFELEKALVKLFKQRGYQFAFINERSMVRISYLNFLNEVRHEYYDVSFGNGKLLTEEGNELVFEQRNKLITRRKIIELNDIDQLAIDKIVNTILLK